MIPILVLVSVVWLLTTEPPLLKVYITCTHCTTAVKGRMEQGELCEVNYARAKYRNIPPSNETVPVHFLTFNVRII